MRQRESVTFGAVKKEPYKIKVLCVVCAFNFSVNLARPFCEPIPRLENIKDYSQKQKAVFAPFLLDIF